jgi:hypothetical protein
MSLMKMAIWSYRLYENEILLQWKWNEENEMSDGYWNNV